MSSLTLEALLHEGRRAVRLHAISHEVHYVHSRYGTVRDRAGRRVWFSVRLGSTALHGLDNTPPSLCRVRHKHSSAIRNYGVRLTTTAARYTARGAVSLEHLAQDADGDLLYTFTRIWSDSTRGIQLSPLERLEKLLALVPPPRVHQVRYASCLAAHSKLQGRITPTPRQQGIETPGSSLSSHGGWARLLKRVFSIDMERCPRGHQGA